MKTLDDLASDWLAPACEEHFALPAITNFHGLVQAAWSITGIQNWICPPTGMSTACALLYEREGEHIRRVRAPVEYRWKAYEIERRGGGIESVTRMPAGKPAVMQRIRFERGGRIYLVFGGLPRVWRFSDYWNLPPEDVPMLNVHAIDGGFELDDTKTFGRAQFQVPGLRGVYRDLQAFLDGEETCAHGRVGVAEFQANPGDVVVWWGVQGCEEELALVQPGVGWKLAEEHWDEVWEAAFTRGNKHFSGSLPRREGAFDRLYGMSVLSLLNCRRNLPAPSRRASIATGGQCIWNGGEFAPLERAYVWGGPEGGMTTLFLWELEFQAPILARLDPKILRDLLEAMIRVDLHKSWGFETVTGRGAGMGYGVNPGAFLSCVEDYVRITGDKAWAMARIDYLKSCCKPGLTDYGPYENILECVSTYEHKIAAFNALNVKGLRFVASLTGDANLARQADALAKEVVGLYAGGPFACLQPDGERRIVKTVLDFVYVGRSMPKDLPLEVRKGMVAFVRDELMTDDWLFALSPKDPNALTKFLPSFQTYRADHQATGSYDGWPARVAEVLLEFGERELALRWLGRIEELTREGPFGQARYIHEQTGLHGFSPTTRTRKSSFINGNCYLESCGVGFATLLLERLAQGA